MFLWQWLRKQGVLGWLLFVRTGGWDWPVCFNGSVQPNRELCLAKLALHWKNDQFGH